LQIQWTDAASHDLESIAAYIESDNPKAAVRQVLLVVDAVESLLSQGPAIGHPGRIPHTRELVIPGTKYIVAYRMRDKRLQILRVLYGARKWPERC
jgi:toxin ParE1/3/4